jgi:APA family basic amino acid/polyamine antiporter
MADVQADETTAPGGQPALRRVMGPGLLLLFVVGDILGTGVYALTGKVAAEVGGAVWLPFLCAFGVALLTAFSYLELVTKYPRAAGAALYTHKAFGIHFLTFLVTFAVMSSGLTSASSASKAFAGNSTRRSFPATCPGDLAMFGGDRYRRQPREPAERGDRLIAPAKHSGH